MNTRPSRSFSRREIWEALEESVKLQSHYAKLLNMHDGGERITFADAAAWIARLREVAELRKQLREKEPHLFRETKQ